MHSTQQVQVPYTAALDRGKLLTLIAGKRRRLLFMVDGRRSVCDKKPQRYVDSNDLIVRRGNLKPQ